MPHGVDLLRCLERVRSAQNTEESTSCTLSTKIEPDSRGLVPAIHVSRHQRKTWMPGTSPGMTTERDESAFDVLLFRDFFGLIALDVSLHVSLGAGNADPIAVGEAVRGCGDDT